MVVLGVFSSHAKFYVLLCQFMFLFGADSACAVGSCSLIGVSSFALQEYRVVFRHDGRAPAGFPVSIL